MVYNNPLKQLANSQLGTNARTIRTTALALCYSTTLSPSLFLLFSPLLLFSSFLSLFRPLFPSPSLTFSSSPSPLFLSPPLIFSSSFPSPSPSFPYLLLSLSSSPLFLPSPSLLSNFLSVLYILY